MTKLQALASKLIGLIARFLMGIASLLLTRRAKLEFISSCFAWVFQKLKRNSLELNHESGLGDLHFSINTQCLQLSFYFTGAIHQRNQKPGRNHASFRSGMRPRRNSNGDVASEKMNVMASDNTHDKAHNVFDHIVGDILDAVIGEASDQAFDARGNQSSAARNRFSVNSINHDSQQVPPCNCGRLSSP